MHYTLKYAKFIIILHCPLILGFLYIRPDFIPWDDISPFLIHHKLNIDS